VLPQLPLNTTAEMEIFLFLQQEQYFIIDHSTNMKLLNSFKYNFFRPTFEFNTTGNDHTEGISGSHKE
jgi:hypothetical protein